MEWRISSRLVKFMGALLAAMALAVAPLTVFAATPKKGASYGGKVKRVDNSRDPWVSLKVAGSGKKLKFVGPAERCGGFNPVSALHGRIDSVKITSKGKFTASRKYDVPNDTGSVIFHWDISVTGRFVTKDKAKGTVKFHLTHSGSRSGGVVSDCGRRNLDFTAKRGAKHPGFLDPVN